MPIIDFGITVELEDQLALFAEFLPSLSANGGYDLREIGMRF